MSRAGPLRVERARRRRGTFGLDERRRPDPARTEAEIRDFLRVRLPEVWALPPMVEPGSPGRTVVLLLPRGHAAVLRIEPGADAPGPGARAIVARCGALAIPAAVVASLPQARAALRRFGIEPQPAPSPIALQRIFGRCREKPSL